MRRLIVVRWMFLMAVALGVTGVMPVFAQVARAPREDKLNGVQVGSKFEDVLNAKGAPHYIGPALSGPETIVNILNPPPVSESLPVPGAPEGAGRPGGAGMPGDAGGQEQKPQPEYHIWLYEGDGREPNPGAGFNTYVFFDKHGFVVGVVVAAASPTTWTPARSESGVTVGTRLLEVTRLYNWPQPFARVGQHYYMAYPDRNITFALDSATRSVVVIAVGLPVTVSSTAKSGDSQPGNGLPGGEVMPY